MKGRILNFLKEHPGVPYRKRELARHLKVARSGYRTFRSELKKLQNQGEVFRVREGGYVWVDPGDRIEGKLVVHQKGFGFLLVDDGDDIFVSSRNLMGAIHGDTVEVALLPPPFRRRSEGHVTRIIKRGTDEFVGTVVAQDGTSYLEIDPVTPRRGIRIIEPSPMEFSSWDVVVAKVEDWGTRRRPIQVKVLKVIGSMDRPEDDMKIVCHRFDLDPHFSHKVVTESKRFSREDIEREKGHRADLTQETCITIDPADARDFDDALSIDRDRHGNVVIGVHIADVSFFVAPGSELDREARRRGTSVYFAEGVVSMLPEALSAGLCSLVPEEDRLALSVKITLDNSGDVAGASFHDSVIRNARRFTYREVQSVLDGKMESKYSSMLKEMNRISQVLLGKRQERGSIDFDIPEPIFRFRDGSIPHEIHPSERLDSHRIVEEFMLLANRVVAERVPKSGERHLPFVYRIHDQPPAGDMEKFLDVLTRFQLYHSKTSHISPAEFRKILASVEDSPYRGLIENLALRTMTKAVYSVENRGHYGLAFDMYTHFTSPIRRYPDLLVHRMVKEYALIRRQSTVPFSAKILASVAASSTSASPVPGGRR
ncbi:MAG: ribonuclease R family protein [Fidelibacterota bacterium]